MRLLFPQLIGVGTLMTGHGDDEPSFDPRSWVRTPAAATAAPAPSAPKPSGKLDWRLPAAGGAALLAVAAGGWFMLRPHASAPTPAAAPVATQPTAAATLRQSLTIARMDDLAEALVGGGLDSALAQRIAEAARGGLSSGDADLRVVISLAPGTPPAFQQLEVRRADGSGVLVKPAGAEMAATPLASDLQTRIKVVRGEMDADSFYSSAVAAGVTDSLISDFANAFTFDFDFQREIKPGDIFEAAFEQRVNSAGEAVGAERLVYASLQTQGKSRALYRFQPPGEAQPAWFDGNGSNVARSLMRTPVEGARITSSFGPRTHPVLGYTRVHKGTDFATPIGTTVYASGDGVIDFMGPHGGHGNFIRIRHNAHLQTAYAHLSAYGPGMAVGTQVRQGQAVALTGNTGLSSGPHLHYEVIVDDAQVDPMTFETTSGRQLAGAALAAFRKERDRIDGLRAAQNG